MAVYTVARSQIQPWVASFIIARQASAPLWLLRGLPETPENMHKRVRLMRHMRLKGGVEQSHRPWEGFRPPQYAYHLAVTGASVFG